MDKLYKLLERVRERPGLYIGKCSLRSLYDFLGGYIICLLDLGVNYDSSLLGSFQEYIAERYNITSTHSWGDIITFYCGGDERAAFYRFYELYDEFRSGVPARIETIED